MKFILILIGLGLLILNMELTLKNEARRCKYGLVTVKNEDGTINRQFKITTEEYEALATKGGFPPGVTQEEWESGLASACGKDLEIGDVLEKSDGSLLIKYDEVKKNGQIIESYLRLQPGEWTGKVPNIEVSSQVITDIKSETNEDIKRISGTEKTINSISGGVLTASAVAIEEEPT